MNNICIYVLNKSRTSVEKKLAAKIMDDYHRMISFWEKYFLKQALHLAQSIKGDSSRTLGGKNLMTLPEEPHCIALHALYLKFKFSVFDTPPFNNKTIHYPRACKHTVHRWTNYRCAMCEIMQRAKFAKWKCKCILLLLDVLKK